MIERIKDNFLVILVFIFLFFCGFSALYKYKHDDDIWYAKDVENYKQCQIDSSYSTACVKYTEPVKRRDTLNTLGYISTIDRGMSLLRMLAPLLIIIIVSTEFNRKLRKGYFKNSVIRIGYKNSFRNLYLNVLKNAFILPIFLAFLLIGCYCISGNFDYNYGVSFYMYDSFGIENCKNIIIFLIVYFSNFILHGIFWINIAIYNCRHNRYSVVSIIFSYIEYILLFIILDELAAVIFSQSSMALYFNFTHIWSFLGSSLIGILISSLIPAFLSTMMVLNSYKNKEKVLSDL